MRLEGLRFEWRALALVCALLAACAGSGANSAQPASTERLTALPPLTPQSSILDPYMPTEPIQPVAAPFAMPQPARPRIPAGVFDIRELGAIGDGKTKATQAFRAAIAKA